MHLIRIASVNVLLIFIITFRPGRHIIFDVRQIGELLCQIQNTRRVYIYTIM